MSEGWPEDVALESQGVGRFDGSPVFLPLFPLFCARFNVSDAWPVVVDEFVEKMLAQKKASTSETERP